ncbi:hypothetical protein D3C80_1673440 [compost metagenome]
MDLGHQNHHQYQSTSGSLAPCINLYAPYVLRFLSRVYLLTGSAAEYHFELDVLNVRSTMQAPQVQSFQHRLLEWQDIQVTCLLNTLDTTTP